MPSIMECVPNFSEGCDARVLELLKQKAAGIPGVALLDIHADTDHNRSVFTLAGSPAGITEVAFILAETALRKIDLNRQTGQHPRMGAVDVIPFVPISGVTMDDCAAAARTVGERIGRELKLPVFLYEQAASRPSRVNLADIRRGGFEGLSVKLAQPDWLPDYGPRQPHPTGGAVAVGARKPLVAFNLLLDTPDIRIAKAVAAAVRESGGGLPYVKALGLYLSRRNAAQVSMNLTDYEQTPVSLVFERVAQEAARYGAAVIESELVGLAPARFFTDCAAQYLKLAAYDPDRQIIENHVRQESYL